MSEPQLIDFGIEYGEPVTDTCEKHGDYSAKPYRISGLAGSSWRKTECPGCKSEREERELADKLDRAAAERRDRVGRRAILAGIPARFRGVSLDAYAVEGDAQRRVHRVMRRYADAFDDRRKVGGGLILCGRPGTGKTYLLCALGLELVQRWEIKYTDCWTMVGAVKATFRRGNEQAEDEVIAAFVKPDLLLVDEVGVQYGTDAERAIIHRVLDLRYQEVKPTIVSGNVDLAGMSEYLGERAVSRLHEAGGLVLNFDWDDYRKRVPKRESQ